MNIKDTIKDEAATLIAASYAALMRARNEPLNKGRESMLQVVNNARGKQQPNMWSRSEVLMVASYETLLAMEKAPNSEQANDACLELVATATAFLALSRGTQPSLAMLLGETDTPAPALTEAEVRTWEQQLADKSRELHAAQQLINELSNTLRIKEDRITELERNEVEHNAKLREYEAQIETLSKAKPVIPAGAPVSVQKPVLVTRVEDVSAATRKAIVDAHREEKAEVTQQVTALLGKLEHVIGSAKFENLLVPDAMALLRIRVDDLVS